VAGEKQAFAQCRSRPGARFLADELFIECLPEFGATVATKGVKKDRPARFFG
jgi:hypothetical protein